MDETKSTSESSVDITIIVAFRDAERCIARCLESLCSQHVPDRTFEILAVDNGSRDASASIAASFPGVHSLTEETPGVYFARNHGLDNARGSIIVFTDPDCVAEPGWLERITRPLASAAIKVALGHTRLAGRSMVLRTLEEYETTRDRVIFAGDDPECYYGRCNNQAVRREVFDEIGPFVTAARGGDSVLVRACADKYGCDAIVYEPSARVNHLEIGGATSYFAKIFIYARSMRRFSQLITTRPPSRDVRNRVFRRSCTDHSYSIVRCALLRALLLFESATWMLGWWSGSRKSSLRSARIVP